MSGILALYNRDRSAVDRSAVERMQGAMDHRGPDGSDSWDGDGVALGHQHLRSTPEGRYDSQPCRDGDTVVVADARLDNRPELLSELQLSSPPERIPDSELLLAAYRQWGTGCVSRLAGAFAFVVWDGDQLFCARDRFGVKPLYYHRSPELFAVASEKKGLLAHPSIAGDIDEVKIGDFLVELYEDTSRTYFESLDRLPPAHAMTVDTETTEQWRYWSLDPTRTVTLDSDAAYERRFRELFEQAVRSRMRTDGPVGSALSGGMDSSSITVVARELLPDDEPLHTFSNVYDEAPSSDEREYIEAVTSREGIESHYIFPEDVGALVDEARLRAHFDQPPHNTMHFAGWERTKRAADVGVSTVLGGALGDSAIGYGLGLLPELLWTGRWGSLYRELSAMSGLVDAPVRHLFVRHALSEVVPESVLRVRRRVNGTQWSLADENPTIDQAFADRIGLRTRYETRQLRGAALTPRARRRQCRSLLTGRNATNFEALDLIHAAFGVEPRYPFTDHRLVEFSLAMPATQQLKDGWTRSIGRRALGDLLPEPIQWRPWKTPTNEAFWNALERDRGRLVDLADEPGALAPFVDAHALHESLDRFETERNSRDGRALWRALSLSVWLDAWG
ncbi:asparagine synthase (glutamine-hydrolyzing) [Haloarcula sp. S1CR25-12]|uniref:Putative asparagine synthetase [glutamine-hydrolyzing] n=1 Tax=Haloarcula saliterrae TaxID=2950534 RepID=A0ABU2FGQ4_9EURY|nr:asparagine synthase (glutamine-hydrolyzing) [Haloarcula sp. S1CR25-12]MDS0261447.1 asparagine synthase (glutamine-hydrolyzing) [Haloarcula sp. S1CR25-12]